MVVVDPHIAYRAVPHNRFLVFEYYVAVVSLRVVSDFGQRCRLALGSRVIKETRNKFV